MKSPQYIALDLFLATQKVRGITSLKPLKEFNPDKTSNVPVISCTAMGDTLFATPAIKALSELLVVFLFISPDFSRIRKVDSEQAPPCILNQAAWLINSHAGTCSIPSMLPRYASSRDITFFG